MTDEEMLAEIFRIYKPVESRPHPGFRVYYNADTLEIICFSQDELPHPYCQVTKEVYETFRPDLFKIEDGKVIRKQKVARVKTDKDAISFPQGFSFDFKPVRAEMFKDHVKLYF